MSAYLETQLAVYQHLLTRHEKDPSFKFSVRQKEFAGNGLFIGREFPKDKKPYFAFTCWRITSGSPGEILSYEVRQKGVVSFEVGMDLFPRPQGNQQDAYNRLLAERVSQQVPGSWKGKGVKRHTEITTNTITKVLTALDALLNRTKKPLDKLVGQLKREHPDWKGGPITADEFEQNLGRLQQKRAALLAGKFDEITREQQATKTIPNATPEKRQYYWLNFSPDIWSIAKAKLGTEQSYTTHYEKEKGVWRARPNSKFLELMKPGDQIIGYESTPSLIVDSLLEVLEPATQQRKKDRKMRFRVVERFTPPLAYKELKNRKELQHIGAFGTNRSCVYPLSATEFELIEKLAREPQGLLAPPPFAAPAYTSATARTEGVFLHEAEINEMVEALKIKQNIILKGPPGVGKTFVARKLAYVLFGEKDPARVELTQFHQSVSYEDFVRGWRPGAHGSLTIADGPLLTFAEKARTDGRPHVLIIDEINRGNLSKIFGELFMLLEADKRQADYGVRLTYQKSDEEAKFFLPPNLYLIGTMNTADRSLALVDYALRRRFRFFELRPQLGDALTDFLVRHHQADAAALTPRLAVVRELNALISNLKEEPLLGPGFVIGHSYFCPAHTHQLLDDVAKWFAGIIAHELLPLLEEYWDGDPKGGQKLKKWKDKLLGAPTASTATADLSAETTSETAAALPAVTAP